MHRVPTVSRVSAIDFVEAYLQHLGSGAHPNSSTALNFIKLHRILTDVDAFHIFSPPLRFRRKGFGGLVSFCFRVAMPGNPSGPSVPRLRQDVNDELCSLVEFLSLTPKAHEVPPAVRLLAWACYVMNAKKWDLAGLAAIWSKRHLYVDQVGAKCFYACH